jgi:phosphatidylinositol glycan class O
MGEKLLEMNEILTRVFNLVTEDTLVIVMGDHGMDKKGDHGGDSFPEMDAGLFFYSKTKLYPQNNREFIQKIIQKTLEIDGYEIFSKMDNDR